MEIRISSLKDGAYPFSFDLPASNIELDESFIGNVTVAGELRKVSSQIVLQSRIEADYRKQCDRCLADVTGHVNVALDLYFREGHGAVPDEDDQVRHIDPDQDTIVLDDEVRQIILLSLPLKYLCQEECKGLCATCGADLNNGECSCVEAEVDPRWAKLADLFKKDDDKQKQ